MNTNLAIGERVKHIREQEKGMSVAAFARLLNEKDHRIRDIESGKQKIPPEIITKLRNILNINPDWLLTGEGEMYKQTEKRVQVIDEKNGIEVNYYPEVYAAAGYGATNTLIEPKRIKLAEFVLKFFGIRNYKKVDIINVLGDSMEPVFSNGDLAVVERIESIEEVKNGDTVITNIDGDVYIKKVEKIPFENKLILKSNNTLYKDILIDLDEHKNVKIVAIVRGKFRAV